MKIGFSSTVDYKNKVICDENKHLHLKLTNNANGDAYSWAYAHRPNAKNCVIIVPVIHEENGDSIIFEETERPPIKTEGIADRCIELPAGKVGDENPDETVKEAITKELLEETGYAYDKLTIKGKNISSCPGVLSEVATYSIAEINKDEKKQEPLTDNGMIKKLHKVPVENIKNWLQKQQDSGKSISAQALSGLYYFFENKNN